MNSLGVGVEPSNTVRSKNSDMCFQLHGELDEIFKSVASTKQHMLAKTVPVILIEAYPVFELNRPLGEDWRFGVFNDQSHLYETKHLFIVVTPCYCTQDMGQ